VRCLRAAVFLAAGGEERPASPALPLRLGELREQAHEELRQGGGRDGVGAVVGGAPAELPAFLAAIARHFEASGAVG